MHARTLAGVIRPSRAVPEVRSAEAAGTIVIAPALSFGFNRGVIWHRAD